MEIKNIKLSSNIDSKFFGPYVNIHFCKIPESENETKKKNKKEDKYHSSADQLGDQQMICSHLVLLSRLLAPQSNCKQSIPYINSYYSIDNPK